MTTRCQRHLLSNAFAQESIKGCPAKLARLVLRGIQADVACLATATGGHQLATQKQVFVRTAKTTPRVTVAKFVAKVSPELQRKDVLF